MILETTPEDYAALIQSSAPRDLRLPDTPIAPPEILEMLAGVAATVAAAFTPAAWLIVEGDELVGLCSIKEPPIEGAFEIGYGIAPSRQGRGHASAAVAAIVAWAASRPDIRAITAETLPEGAASQRVLTRNGFIRIGERVDEEDGLVWCWRRDIG